MKTFLQKKAIRSFPQNDWQKKLKVPPVHFQRLKNFKNLQHRLDVVQQILRKSFVLTRAKIALFIFQRGQCKICSSINFKIFEKRVAFV